MREERILAAAGGPVLYLKLEGDLRFPLAPLLEAVIGGFDGPHAFEALRVDLNDVAHLDSTMLGLLVRLARRARRQGMPKPVLLSANEDVDLLLETMGFDAVYQLAHGASDPPGDLADVQSVEEPGALPEQVLDAHQALMNVNERNRRVFGPAVDALRNELGRPS